MRRQANIPAKVIAKVLSARPFSQSDKQVCQQHASDAQTAVFGDEIVDEILKPDGVRVKITVHHDGISGRCRFLIVGRSRQKGLRDFEGKPRDNKCNQLANAQGLINVFEVSEGIGQGQAQLFCE